jgi:iron complex transport system ATP-binding protein
MTDLKVHNLWFGYNTDPVLQDVCLTAEPGSVSGLLGPNASGKTTLFKCMNGILHPQSGRVCISGKPVAGIPKKDLAQIMAVVPQQTGAIFSFTARQMVVMAKASGLAMWQRPSKTDFAGAEKALDDIGAGGLSRRMFNDLSGGEKQMVLLARAMFQCPEVLLLDEPTAHLDFKNQHLILDMVRNVTKEKNLTTIITLHDPNLAARYCDDVVMLKSGEVYDQGPVQDVFCEKNLESVYGIKVMVTGYNRSDCLVVPRTNAAGDVMF